MHYVKLTGLARVLAVGISNYIRDLRVHVGHDLLMLPGICAVVLNDRGEVLLGRRSDTGSWGLPAGAMDPDESPADATVREVWEETGVRVAVEKLIGVDTYDVTYPHGDHCQYLTAWFRCRAVGGEAQVNDDESTEVAWFAYADLPDVPPTVKHRIDVALDDTAPAWFAPAGSRDAIVRAH